MIKRSYRTLAVFCVSSLFLTMAFAQNSTNGDDRKGINVPKDMKDAVAMAANLAPGTPIEVSNRSVPGVIPSRVVPKTENSNLPYVGGGSTRKLAAALCTKEGGANRGTTINPKFFPLLGLGAQSAIVGADETHLQGIFMPKSACTDDKTLATNVPIWLIIFHNVNAQAKEAYIYYVVDGGLSTIVHAVNGVNTVVPETEIISGTQMSVKDDYTDQITNYWPDPKRLGPIQISQNSQN
jgi:hypothetical protein